MRRYWLVPFFLFPFLLNGYVPGRTVLDGPTFHRTDAANIQLVISDQVRGGITNADGLLLVTPDSDPVAAVRSAIATLNGFEDASFRFADLRVAPDDPMPSDGINSVSFTDTPQIRSIVGTALAVSLNSIFSDGSITQGDVFINPDVLRDGVENPFATTGAENASDIESTVLHELLHSLGASHSSVLGATMYPFGRDGETFARTPSTDDIAFAVDIYPGDQAAGRFGRIQGTATFAGGGPIRGAAVTAVDPAFGTVVAGLTAQDGTFDFLVPPSSPGSGYAIYIEPLDGPVTPGDVGLQGSEADVEFQNAFAPGAGLDGGVPVAGGQTVTMDITAQAGPPVIDVLRFGFIDPVTRSFQQAFGPLEVPDAPTAELIMFGPGLETIQPGDLRVLNPRVTVMQNGIMVNPRNTLNGFPAVTVPLGISSASGPTQNLPNGGLGTIVITVGPATTAFTGALVLEGPGEQEPPPPTPIFSGSGLLNAASFGSAGTVAAETIVSLFGVELANRRVVVSVLPLPTTAGGTTFEVIDSAGATRPSPFFFVDPNQSNFLIPAGTAVGPATLRVRRASGSMAEAGIAVGRVSPGLFSARANGEGVAAAFALRVLADGTQQQVLMFDGSLNPVPIDISRQGEQVFLLLFGTGIRGFANSVTATVGDQPVAVLGAVPQGGFVGLDQVNIGPLPVSLVGRGEVEIKITADGVEANPVTVLIP